MTRAPLSLFLAGDAILATPWSRVETPAFLALVRHMRAADVTIVNLETVVHAFRGYAQADSGGTWCASPPVIARELAWAGVDMVAHANNHAFDYGSEGILETIESVAAAGIALSGSGRDLQAATRPAIFDAHGRRVAHVAMAETFVRYGRASTSRPDLRGRPGVNPLPSIGHSAVQVTPALVALMKRLDGWLGRSVRHYDRQAFRRFRQNFEVGSRNAILPRGSRLVAADRARNLAAIAEAAATADLTVVSIHSHIAAAWQREFLRSAVAAGADVVMIHGPHEIRGLEFVNGRPVFHGLGDFAYQTEHFTVQPAEAYASAGLGDTAGPADLIALPNDLSNRRATFEGCAAVLRYDADKRPAITLLPIDLQFDAAIPDRGRPQLADPALGRRLIGEFAAKSARHGTRIRYDEASNSGIVELT